MSELSPYAFDPRHSRGREHAEQINTSRNPFEIDRQRILSCTAFRRLQYKAQVFTDQRHDHFRTRLSHTLEVADIARRLAVALRANEQLVECIALAHDLGHPPFGHAGERALESAMINHGGFEHNVRSLRVVEYLEHPYPPFRGLNLTYEVRDGLATHETRYDRPQSEPETDGVGLVRSNRSPRPSVESQIVSCADRIAYDSHDIEDALGAQILNEDSLNTLSLWCDAAIRWRETYSDMKLAAIRRPILDTLIAILIDDVAAESCVRLERLMQTSGGCNPPSILVVFSEQTAGAVESLEGFLATYVYRHPDVVRADSEAEQIVSGLFQAYLDDSKWLPERFSHRIPEQGIHRVVCDYISGMTDRFCRDEFARVTA